MFKAATKIISFLLIILIASAFAGCAPATVEGVWKQDVPQQFVTDEERDNEGNVKTSPDGTARTLTKVIGEAYTAIWTFNNGNLTMQRETEGASPDFYSYTISGNNIILTYVDDGSGESIEVTYRYTFLNGGRTLALNGEIDYVELHR